MISAYRFFVDMITKYVQAEYTSVLSHSHGFVITIYKLRV
jgi:hypothetical protein